MTMRSGEVYEQPLQRLVVREGTAETGGARLLADLYVPPGTAGVPRHVHPALEEHITVIDGRIGAWMDGQERVLESGERLAITPGTAHSWWPVGDREARVLLDVHPAARFEQHWRQFMGLAQDGKIHPKRGPKFLQIVAIQSEFSDVSRLAAIPAPIQQVLFTLLAPVARLRGYQGANEEYLTRGPSAMTEPEPLPEDAATP